ncbi:MAG: hypothetical protein ACLFNL_08635 [Bacteroidales bacterium]
MKRTHFKIEGIDEVTNNIKKVMDAKGEKMTTSGFIKTGILLRRTMENEPPLVPVDTGNLRASWFTVIKGKGEVNTGKTPLAKPQEVSPEDLQKQKNVVSFFKSVSESKKMPNMIFGFSANYAAAVHEMMGKVHWQKAGSGPKYMERHLKNKQDEIIKILAEEGKKAGNNKGKKK